MHSETPLEVELAMGESDGGGWLTTLTTDLFSAGRSAPGLNPASWHSTVQFTMGRLGRTGAVQLIPMMLTNAKGTSG